MAQDVGKVQESKASDSRPKLPTGFRASGVHCGIKSNAKSLDIALIVSDVPCTAAGVYTKNQICAAPVVLDRQRTPSENLRAVITNSGNANACTGPQGMLDAIAMTETTGQACGVSANEVLVMSTGIIGERLEINKVELGIHEAANSLTNEPEGLAAAAAGILTTDTVEKSASCQLMVGEDSVTITGIAKGSGMIAPNMATMLAVVMTDAKIKAPVAQAMLSEICDRTFNCISVDGHTSTNDTVLFLANGAATKTEMDDRSTASFRNALEAICLQLARAIVNDGEGATRSIEIHVTGCESASDAHCIAKAVGDSPLVKTAIAGADPNWGRIVSAAGYAGPKFDPSALSMKLNGATLFELGTPLAFDRDAVARSMKESHEVVIELQFSEGDEQARYWTCDLTAEYVRINAEYHT